MREIQINIRMNNYEVGMLDTIRKDWEMSRADAVRYMIVREYHRPNEE